MFKAVLRTSVYPIASTCISVKINGSFDDTQRRPGVAVCYLWKCNCTNLIFYQKIPKNFIKIVIVIKRYKKLAQGNSTWAPWISVHFLKPFDTASHTRWHNSLPIGENVSSFRLLRTSTERLFCIYTCFLTKQQKKSKGGGGSVRSGLLIGYSVVSLLPIKSERHFHLRNSAQSSHGKPEPHHAHT